MQYRRAKTPGGTFFFTVVTHRRRKILCEPENINLLRQAFRAVMGDHPFKIDATVRNPGINFRGFPDALPGVSPRRSRITL